MKYEIQTIYDGLGDSTKDYFKVISDKKVLGVFFDITLANIFVASLELRDLFANHYKR